MIEIETRRLRLRGWTGDDVEPLSVMMEDPAFVKFNGTGHPMSRDATWQMVATMIGHWALNGFGYWAVEHRESGQFIGNCGLWQSPGSPGLEIAWMIASSHQGQGYASEAARAALRFAFEELEAQEVIAIIHPKNTPSIHVAQNIGQHFRHLGPHKGKLSAFFSMHRQAWLSRPAA